jgi:hypothetical protein
LDEFEVLEFPLGSKWQPSTLLLEREWGCPWMVLTAGIPFMIATGIGTI